MPVKGSLYDPKIGNVDMLDPNFERQYNHDLDLADLDEIQDFRIVNQKYGRIMNDYMRCVMTAMQTNETIGQLERQLERRDLVTVCAYEYYLMKKNFT